MSRLNHADLGDVPHHSILSEPWAYRVTELQVTFSHDSQLDSALILTLVRDESRAELHFDGVQELEIDAGFPYFNMGLEIFDISQLHWDGIKVRVQGFEPAPGIRFWARSVLLHRSPSSGEDT